MNGETTRQAVRKPRPIGPAIPSAAVGRFPVSHSLGGARTLAELVEDRVAACAGGLAGHMRVGKATHRTPDSVPK